MFILFEIIKRRVRRELFKFRIYNLYLAHGRLYLEENEDLYTQRRNHSDTEPAHSTDSSTDATLARNERKDVGKKRFNYNGRCMQMKTWRLPQIVLFRVKVAHDSRTAALGSNGGGQGRFVVQFQFKHQFKLQWNCNVKISWTESNRAVIEIQIGMVLLNFVEIFPYEFEIFPPLRSFCAERKRPTWL